MVMALAVGSVAMATASYRAFSRVLTATVDSRLLEVANEVARHVDDGLQAGVPLSQQRRILEVLDEERSQATDLATVRVVDDRNIIAFSTSRAEIGEAFAEFQTPGQPLLVGVDSAAGTVRRDGTRYITLERPLIGLFGEPLGRVLVALELSSVADQRQRYVTSLALVVAAITGGGGLLIALLLSLIPIPTERKLQVLRSRLERLFVEAAEGTPDAPPAGPAALPDALAAFEDAARERVRRINEREATLQRLDEGS